MKIDLLELFSGTGGFTKGLQEAGFEINKHWYSEVDKHAIANYKYNFKDAKYIGSVTNVRHIIRTINANRGSNLVITFGSPCQDFSLAGKGKGLDGTKSSLIKYALFLIKWLRPDFFIWENVKGAYSTNDGADYWAIIQAFANLDGYRHEQQLLNTSWFLPQNRERIYSVGYIAERCGEGIFPIGEIGQGINEGVSEASTVRTISGGGHSGGHHSAMTLVRPMSDQPFEEGTIAPTLRNSDKGEIRIVTNTEEGFEVAEEGDSINLSNPNSKTRRGRVGKGKAQTLDTQSNQEVVISHYGHKNKEAVVSKISPTLKAESHGHEPMVTVNQINPCLESGGKQPYQQNRIFDANGLYPTIDSKAGVWKVKTNNIRRLTEIECEHLQGFPDDWTKWGIYDRQVWINKKEKTFRIVENLEEIPKTQRYKLMGNAVTVAVVKAVGVNILKTLKKVA